MANIANVKVKAGNVLELSGSSVSISGSGGLNLHTQNGGIVADAGTGAIQLTASAGVGIQGDLRVSGTIEAHTLKIIETVQSSSVVQRNGSTRFGDTEGAFGAGDLHEFSGSVSISDQLRAASLTGSLSGSYITGLGDKQLLVGTTSGDNVVREISGSAGVVVDYDTAGKIILSVATTGNDAFVTVASEQTVTGKKIFQNALNQFTGSFSGSAQITNINDLAVTSIVGGSGLTATESNGQVTLNIGQGDGITVNADEIAVDSTVVRTSGDQSIAGTKSFSDAIILGNASQLISSGSVIISGSSGLLIEEDSKLIVSGSTELHGSTLIDGTLEASKSLSLTGILSVLTGETGSVNNNHAVVLSADNAEIGLPAAVNGRTLIVKKIDEGGQGVHISGSNQQIDGDLIYSLYGPYQSVTLIASGSAWYVL